MFLFRLARELGMTCRQLTDSMDSREVAEWMAFFAAEAKKSDEDKAAPKQDSEEVIKAKLRSVVPRGGR